ncbi:MAG: Nif11 domain [Firmicutes bacterium]|nr:Nif11 domain [Bacillota bacterium]
MEQEKVTAYLAKLIENKEFQGKMEQAKSPETALAIVKEYGFNFEMDEFQQLMQIVLLKARQEQGEELNDQELAIAAGGMSDADLAATITGSVSAGAAVVGAIAGCVAAAAAAA